MRTSAPEPLREEHELPDGRYLLAYWSRPRRGERPPTDDPRHPEPEPEPGPGPEPEPGQDRERA